MPDALRHLLDNQTACLVFSYLTIGLGVLCLIDLIQSNVQRYKRDQLSKSTRTAEDYEVRKYRDLPKYGKH